MDVESMGRALASLPGERPIEEIMAHASACALADPEIHRWRDPMSGSCLNCGATIEEISDNLAPTCDRIEGPHRIALLGLIKVRRHRQAELTSLRQQHQQAENMVVTLGRRIREEDAHLRELEATIAGLRGET